MADAKISALTASTTPLAGTEVLPIVQSGVTKQVSVANLTAGRDVAAQSMTVNQSGMTTPASFGQFPGSTSYGQVNFNGATTLGGLSGLIGGSTAGTMFLNVPTGGTMNLLNGGGFVLQLGASDVTVSTGNLVIGTSGKGIDFSATPGTGTSELLADYEEGTWTPTVAVNPGTATSYTISKSVYTKVGNQVTAKTEIVPIGGTFGNGVGFSQINGLPFAASGNFAGSVLNSANFTLGQSALAATSTATTSLIVMAGLIISTGNTATFQVTYSV